MPDVWVPSDELLSGDPVAQQKIVTPFDPPDLSAGGIVLPDLEDDDDKLAAEAALVLAELEDDDVMGRGDPNVADDDDIADPDDEPVAGEI
jgi:hypothetical protein